ncbi:terminase small subunit [uncultured Deinococcus sp.]|uniref:terminase small subunit n=1 Tax=uncultured Deinococcus sp. TaxID=158789 RepID=UPI002584F144|nr:terminase small subunit [uncultured Deinococcus sp.]
MTQPETPRIPTADELGAALRPRDRVLADTYLATWNKRLAGEAAKYSEKGKKYLDRFKREDVRAYIAARLSEEVMSAEEVLARLSARARLSGEDFFEQQAYEVSVYEDRPLQLKIDNLEAQVGQMLAYDPEVLKPRVEKLQAQISELTVELALDPAATYRVQVGTETRYRTVPSLEAARRNGVLQFVEGAEYGPSGLKFKWADALRAQELLGKHHKLFTEKHEHSGRVGMVIGIDIVPPEGAQ